MRAVVVAEYGGPDVLSVADLADQRPGPGEIAVRVAVAGVNFIDVYQRSGVYRDALPFVAGVEGAGTVAALGPGVTGLTVGERVGWVNQPGSYAERIVLPAARAVRLPATVSDRQAASVLLQGMTAHYLTHDVHRVRPGDTVLVHAAAGGTGLLLTSLATALGGRVIGTVSTAAKEAAARAAGAAEVIRYRDTDVATAVRELTGGAGVDVVYDGIGGPTFEASLASVRPRGMLAVFGQAGGPVPPLDVQRLNAAGSIFLTRPNLAHYIGDPAELARRAGAVLDHVQAGTLAANHGGDYPLDRAGDAHADLEAGRTTGKLLLEL